jgi:uncharacterized protein (TIGR02145 family)
LNYAAEGSKCYNNLDHNCETYGRLYNWATANAVCPEGWHLPSDADWDALMTAVGGSSTAGTKLKATSGWNSSGNGTNDYRFSALPGGHVSSDGSFRYVGSSGDWWNATEDNACCAQVSEIHSSGYNHTENYKSSLLSVRCVKD